MLWDGKISKRGRDNIENLSAKMGICLGDVSLHRIRAGDQSLQGLGKKFGAFQQQIPNGTIVEQFPWFPAQTHLGARAMLR
jgi:hypothetical protein